ncbi:MmpS family transport accessory protein [Mycobacterium sp. Marseille-P9652]|uniref:MmpS family transport accessory protein n=1 Tax=Mycobacterium sp. Marseille-P9652 TaxID=2654950 RepID=UPI0012E7FF73|nr:MmpS family transport accessory protein [Mycobacterium sp. Marseille-P9652]
MPTVRTYSPASVARRWWPLLVVVVVAAVAAFCVYRLHGVFGSHHNTSAGGGLSEQTEPFNPKRITLEVFGDANATATINYVDINVQPQQVMNATLPWTLTMVTTQPGAFTNVVAQGNSRSLGCRILVDGEVKDERVVNEVNAYTFCLVKSA